MRPWNGKEIFVNLQKQPQLFLKNDNDIMEHFRIVHGDMFSKYDSGSLSRSRDKQVSDAIARLSDDYVLNVNEEDYIQYLIDEYTLYMPVISSLIMYQPTIPILLLVHPFISLI